MRRTLLDPSVPLPRTAGIRLLVRTVDGPALFHLQAPGLHLLLGVAGEARNLQDKIGVPEDSLLLLPSDDSMSLSVQGRGLVLSFDLPDDHELQGFTVPFLLLPLSAHSTGTWAASLVPALTGREAIADRAARDLVAGAARRIAEVAEHGLSGIDGIAAVRARTRARRLARVETARAYLEQHLDRRVNLSEVAHLAGMSEFHLHRAFVEVWGQGPGAFHARARLERAGSLIRSGMSPAAAARATGYSSHASFHRAFVRMYGHTPAQAASTAS